MTPEQQRIAIAEACGWKLNSDDPSPSWSKTWIHPLTKKIGYEVKDIPDYINDLNAMHEAENNLTKERQEAYGYNLLTVCNPSALTRRGWNSHHATAAQRAEAFLRTIGKWKDGE